jgi:hypothetical protein
MGRPDRIVSGGQTGVDRAALESGRRLGIPVGGWCPAGGAAEDLTTPPGVRALYPELRETESADPAERTWLNVRDSDATLVLVRERAVSPGTARTVEVAEELGRPCLVVDVHEVETVVDWLADLPSALVLNVAGPRESQEPGIQEDAERLLDAVLAR